MLIVAFGHSDHAGCFTTCRGTTASRITARPITARPTAVSDFTKPFTTLAKWPRSVRGDLMHASRGPEQLLAQNDPSSGYFQVRLSVKTPTKPGLRVPLSGHRSQAIFA